MRLLLLFSLLLSLSTSLSAEGKRNILVLLSFHQTLPWTKQFLSGIDEYTHKYEFFIEEIDDFRTKSASNSDMWVDYLKNRYKDVKFDGIIVESEVAANLYKNIASRLEMNVPSIVLSERDDVGDYRIYFDHLEIAKKSIDLAFMHNRELKHFYIIDSDFIEAIYYRDALIIELEKRDLNYTLIRDFTKNSLLKKVQNISKNSAIFFTILFEDANKERFIPKMILEEIARATSVPVYVFYNSLMGSGAIGGVTQDGAKIARKMIETLDIYLNSGEFPKQGDYFLKTVDWSVMKRFGIKEQNNPLDVEFINRDIPIWESYPKETLYGTLLLLLLVVLIIVLFMLGVRNKKIENMKKQLLVQSRHAAMGEMLSAIAHQWRQPLNTLYIVLQSYRTIFKAHKIEDENIERLNSKSDKLVHQMSSTIDDFKDFFKPTKERRVFRPKEELVRSIGLIDSAFAKDRIDIDIESLRDETIFGYPNDLGQCFLNILQNARDELKNRDGDRTISISMRRKNGHITISFEDSGKGVPKEIKESIFEPYFTTKESENGTGLGLYMTKMIIEEHMNGKITLHSSPLGGAKFVISLLVYDKTLQQGEINA